ncbi:DUF4132 domain-containing protein [Actinoplanes sp. NPDC051411]|uniref:DUF4132 domain-containing protein n=1 Tax=Actinoplanes sp. NPDC051411 TaxID=3155522 RepID=UPI003418CC54
MWRSLLPEVPPGPAGLDETRLERPLGPVSLPVPDDPAGEPIALVAEAVGRMAEMVGLREMRQVVGPWPAEQRRLVALQIALWHAYDDWPSVGVGRAWVALLRGPVGFRRDDLLWSLAVLAESEARHLGQAHHLPALIAAELPDDQLSGLLPVFEAVLSARDEIDTLDERLRVTRLYSDVIDRLTDHLPPYLLHDGDRVGPAIRAALGGRLSGTGMRPLLLHAVSLAKPVPTRGWLRTAESRLAAAPDGAAVARVMLETFAARGEEIHEDTDTLLRGMVWLVAADPGEEASAALARAAVVAGSPPSRSVGYPIAPRVAAAAVEALAGREGDTARALVALSAAVRYKALKTRVSSALDRAAERRGWAPGEAAERAVDDHPARVFGRPGGLELIVEIDGEKARLRAVRDGRPLKSVPPGVDADEPRAVVKALTRTLGRERERLEGLLSAEREWGWETWVTRYLEHPVTGPIAARLIWEGSDDGVTWTPALPPFDRFQRVRLWHPLRATPGEVTGWRDRIVESGLRQPFKQAFREVYPLTPAEEETRIYSNRFAAHVLRYPQAAALMRARGWHGDYLGFFDGGYDSEATREFAGGAWRASFRHELVDEEVHGRVAFCSTDQVRFARRDGTAWTPAALTEVPPLVFSEAMRDVDLFVGVTSIAADDSWADRGEHPFFPYWERTGFGALTAAAKVRRDVLRRLLPRLTIAARVKLDDRFLRVTGVRGAYKIHLGSGNVLIEPTDRYLCIVPSGKPSGKSPALPFDDDRLLSVILSKAIMLAADDKISDPSIVRQLPS